jgi:hypothetical protein
MTDLREMIGAKEARVEGFYWLVLGQNPPESGGGWPVTRGPRQTEAVTVASGRLAFQTTPGTGRLTGDTAHESSTFSEGATT